MTVTTLVIKFPKLGVQTSTWVDEEWWDTLSRVQQEACVRRFVKNAYPRELITSKQMKYRKNTEDYTWNVL